MDPKEKSRLTGGPESSGTGVNQPTAIIPFITSKSLIPTTSNFQKCSPSPNSETPKILSRNCNGTVVLTSSPNNEAELQLYRVMQRASLLMYYDTLLEMGGDDVQQLCDAGEEEFLEIMALVGMASKPLHVRRLQKALQEWVNSPALFQTPLTTSAPSSSNSMSHLALNSVPCVSSAGSSLTFTASSNNKNTLPARVVTPSASPEPNEVVSEASTTHKDVGSRGHSPGPAGGNRALVSPSNLNPILVESQILKLAEAAEALVKTLPQFEPKPHNTKKKICRNLEKVMNMAEDEPQRMDEIRKYAAIYGRFDCKRNPQKPLTLHEVSVNEAAAQICRFAPALLTRRDDLFSLARQVVRDSGYHYIKGQSSIFCSARPQSYQSGCKTAEENNCAKKAKLDQGSVASSTCDGFDLEKLKRQDRLEQIAEELHILGNKTEELVQAAQQVRQSNDLSSVQSLQEQMEVVQNKQTQLLVEQSELLKQPLPSRFYRRNGNKSISSHSKNEKNDTDDTDSQFSLSNTSSPSQEVGDSRDSLFCDGENFNSNSNSNGFLPLKSPNKTGKQVGPK